jgi:hypothetical protein
MYTVIKQEYIHTPKPLVLPAEYEDCITSPHDKYVFPEVIITSVSSALVSGGSNLIIMHRHAICHDLYHCKSDFTSEEMHGRISINPRTRALFRIATDRIPFKLLHAASFIDACAVNYAHWMTEVLPRIAVFCSKAEYNHVPILINAELHENLLTSAIHIAGEDREIILVPIGRDVHVNELFITSVCGYVPFEPRGKRQDDHSHGIFSPTAIKSMRDRLLLAAESLPIQDWPKRVYLRRNSQWRNLANSDLIEEVLQSHGFIFVNPEALTLLEQILLFNNADIVVGPSGAGMANLIFTKQSAKVVILVGLNADASYWYWQNIAQSAGANINYVIGPNNDDGLAYHSDYNVSLDAVLESINL